MPLPKILSNFKNKIQQCDSLIANAHKIDKEGNPILPKIDQSQITVAAFLNMFLAWEEYLESSLIEFMTGSLTTSGKQPKRYVFPGDGEKAHSIVRGMNKYFDYSNHQFVIKTVKLFFENGYPYEPHLSAIHSELDDLKTMRNASAHTARYTQQALDALATRIMQSPHSGIMLYDLLIKVIPNSHETVLLNHRDKLLITASKIAIG